MSPDKKEKLRMSFDNYIEFKNIIKLYMKQII